MAPTPSKLILSLLLLFPFYYFSNALSNPKAFNFPIKKDTTTNQYYTTIQIGSNATTFNVVIDLGGKFLYFYSLDYLSAASSYRPISCGSRQCRIADGVGCIFCIASPPVPGCTNNTCSDYALNPFTGTVGYSGLGHDVLHVLSTRGARYPLHKFPFQFSVPVLREGLAGPTAGLIGLGRTRISLQAQLASVYGIPQKFALCLPSSGDNHRGDLVIGETGYTYTGPFSTTPLIRNPVATEGTDIIGNLSVEYFIGVKAIKVGDRTISLNKTLLSIDKKTGGGGTGIRTVRAYTGLERSIYRALVREFVRAAGLMNITRVGSVAPFGACFDSRTVGVSKAGPRVPTVDFVLQRKDVFWRFYGANSMVRVSDAVICLAFVEGGINMVGPTTSVVVGGYQMEDNLLEFDVANSRLGFSSSLLLHGTSCSQFGASS